MGKVESEPNQRLIIKPSDIPLDSSLGLLAFGDIAFEAWRKLKKRNKKADKNEEE